MIKDSKYIIKRVIIGVLISLILSFIYSTARAEEIQMTASDAYWYNSNGSQTLQVQATTVNRNSEPFYVYQGSTSVQTQFLRAVMYFPENQNDNVLNNQWDVSFVVLGYGNFSLVLGGTACYTLSTGTNFNSSFIWRSDGVYSNGRTAEDTQGSIFTENSETSPLWRSVYCPNVKFNRVPTELKMFRDWHDSSDNSKNRLMVSKYWYLRKTLNDNSGVESAINNQTSSINQNQNQNTQSIINNQNQNANKINDSINNSSVDDPTNDLNDMASNEASNSVISDLLLLPVTLFQNIVNSINGTCSTFNLGSLFGNNLTLPCIDISSLIGSQLWGVIDILFCGIFILSIRKKFVDIFENITALKDRGNELE